MLGQDLVAALGESPGAHEVTAVDRDVLDIIDPAACLAFVAGHDFVVNVAAWTAGLFWFYLTEQVTWTLLTPPSRAARGATCRHGTCPPWMLGLVPVT
jgi:hypothetical protein